MPRTPTTSMDDVVAFITVKYHANGMLSTEGHIGDEAFALQLLDQAREAIKDQHARRGVQIITPSRDVEAKPGPNLTRTIGDIPPAERGDLPP